MRSRRRWILHSVGDSKDSPMRSSPAGWPCCGSPTIWPRCAGSPITSWSSSKDTSCMHRTRPVSTPTLPSRCVLFLPGRRRDQPGVRWRQEERAVTSIGWSGLALSLLLVVVAIVVSLWKRLGLERSIAWAAVRAAAQLLAIGLLLQVLLRPGVSIVWAWLWIVVMIVVASVTVRQRAPEVPGLLQLALLAFGCSAVLTLGVLFGLGVFQLNVRTLIPLAGLMIGNSLAATVLVGRRLVADIRDKR